MASARHGQSEERQWAIWQFVGCHFARRDIIERPARRGAATTVHVYGIHGFYPKERTNERKKERPNERTRGKTCAWLPHGEASKPERWTISCLVHYFILVLPSRKYTIGIQDSYSCIYSCELIRRYKGAYSTHHHTIIDGHGDIRNTILYTYYCSSASFMMWCVRSTNASG